MKHTPGPWSFERAPTDQVDQFDIRAAPSLYLAMTPGGTGADEANARLIAAAPELLEALIATMQAATARAHSGSCHCATCKQALAAIARATGQRGDPSEPGHPDNPRSDYTLDREPM